MYDPQAEFYRAMQQARQEAVAADRALSDDARRSHLRLSELHASTAASIVRQAMETGTDGKRTRRNARHVALVKALSRGCPRSVSPAGLTAHA